MTTTKTAPKLRLWEPNLQLQPPDQSGGAKQFLYRVIFCIFALGFQLYLIYRGMYVIDREKHPVDYKANIYIPIWNFVCFGGGIVPTLLIQAYYGKYTAPPFNYPWRVGQMYSSDQTTILKLHVVPAMLWFLATSFQVFAIGLTDSKIPWHRIGGLTFAVPVFSIFDFSAMISCLDKLSPLGAHVIFMEVSLALGTLIFFLMGLFFIAIKDYFAHKICMTFLIITALGPGFFRVLRHFRELVSWRLFKAPQFTNYKDVEDTKHTYNFRNVESTYFTMAFLITDAYAGYTLYQYGVFKDPTHAWLGYFFVALPVLFVIFGATLRYFPSITGLFCRLVPRLSKGDQKDFHWAAALNYNFCVLRDCHAD